MSTKSSGMTVVGISAAARAAARFASARRREAIYRLIEREVASVTFTYRDQPDRATEELDELFGTIEVIGMTGHRDPE